MSYLVVLVLDNLDYCDDVLQAWEDSGAKGITIFESTGLERVRRALYRDDIPLMPSLSDLFRSSETHHRTLFSVVETHDQADRLVQSTKSIIGDLDQPNTGLMFIVQLYEAYGLNKNYPDPA